MATSIVPSGQWDLIAFHAEEIEAGSEASAGKGWELDVDGREDWVLERVAGFRERRATLWVLENARLKIIYGEVYFGRSALESEQ